MIDLLVGVSGLLSVCWSSFEYLVVGSVGEFLLAGLACSIFFPLVAGYFEVFFFSEGSCCLFRKLLPVSSTRSHFLCVLHHSTIFSGKNSSRTTRKHCSVVFC